MREYRITFQRPFVKICLLVKRVFEIIFASLVFINFCQLVNLFSENLKIPGANKCNLFLRNIKKQKLSLCHFF